MQLTVNGDPHDIPENSLVSDLLNLLKLSGPVAVERNGQVVPRAEHHLARLEKDDAIEIVHFVGGG